MQALLTCISVTCETTFFLTEKMKKCIPKCELKITLKEEHFFCKSQLKRMIKMKKAKMRALNHTYRKKPFCKSELKQKIELKAKVSFSKTHFLIADVFEKRFFKSHLCKRR
jgi:hypothetical protein